MKRIKSKAAESHSVVVQKSKKAVSAKVVEYEIIVVFPEKQAL